MLSERILNDEEKDKAESDMKYIMSGVKDDEKAKLRRVDSADTAHKKRKRKSSGTLSLWKSRAINKKEYEAKRSK